MMQPTLCLRYVEREKPFLVMEHIEMLKVPILQQLWRDEWRDSNPTKEEWRDVPVVSEPSS